MPFLLISGIILLVLGLILFFVWWVNIAVLLKAALPFFILLVGGVVTYLGWERLMDKHVEKKCSGGVCLKVNPVGESKSELKGVQEVIIAVNEERHQEENHQETTHSDSSHSEKH